MQALKTWCVGCDDWFHYTCVGVTDDVGEIVCENCKVYNERYKPKQSIVDEHIEKKSAKSTNRGSTQSHVTSRREADLKLQYLTEMKDVQDKLARAKMNADKSKLNEKFLADQADGDVKFIQLKYNALSEEDAGGSEKSVHTLPSVRRSHVADWVDSVVEDRQHKRQKAGSVRSGSSLKRWFTTLRDSEIATSTPYKQPPETKPTELTKRQAAARQGLSKELSLFSGVAEECL